LRFSVRSFLWIIPLPPILFILGFKVYLSRNFSPHFRYYIPTEDELRQAQIHSQRADNVGNRLEKRFGHPALHQELFTPMVHENMTALLSEVYKGKIDNAQTKLKEYGDTKVDAHIVAGGIKIAGIAQASFGRRVL
jgi:calcium permeable stress-gated cation channel